MSYGGDIYQGLLDRGLKPYQAEAFMNNFVAESGLDPTVNERSPTVEGSRGGRGLYQLTGPRRTAYEARYGDDYDIDSQLDWLMYELSGPEKAAAEKILDAPDESTTTQAITKYFLRPAKVTDRTGMWSGDTSGSTTPATGGKSGSLLSTSGGVTKPAYQSDSVDAIAQRLFGQRDDFDAEAWQRGGSAREALSAGLQGIADIWGTF